MKILRVEKPNQYADYSKWKRWEGKTQLPTWLARYFEKEIGFSKKKPNAVLEIGFGNGELLEWCRQKNINVIGFEIVPSLVENARRREFEVHEFSIASDEPLPSMMSSKQFDVIVAFDVFEHLTNEEIRQAFKTLYSLLDTSGKLIIRFPNGESPFSMLYQNGDLTHVTYLTEDKLRHLCIGTNMELIEYRNPARILNRTYLLLPHILKCWFKSLIEIVVGYCYYNRRRPLDPSAIAVLAPAQYAATSARQQPS